MKKPIKTPSDTSVEMRELVMPHHTNPQNTVFGGTVMSWIDIAAAMVAARHCNRPVVTAHISDIDFIAPVKMGYHVLIQASLNYVGKTSMIVGVRVTSENPYTGESRVTTRAYLTFVALDDLGRPIAVPELRPETEDDIRRFENAKKRVAMKKEIRETLKSKA
ncbi:MAG TPA: acyl-CoA thioesterase [Bacteriovoracaceae bacterium]|nr:acyl-CoA thioesterase [Bacteriovoracaceae bacterium]